MTTNFELTPDQSKEARRLLDLASAFPSQSAGVVLGQVTRDDRQPAKLILTLAVIDPGRAQRITKIVREQR